MVHLLPFVAGAVIGAGIVSLFDIKNPKEKLKTGKEFVATKIEDGVDTIKAVGECIKEKKSKIKESKTKSEEEILDV